MTQRSVTQIFPALTQSEGAGATVHRTIGRRGLMSLDPFLLLDEFELKEGAGGFPEHPHRGFETVTYMFTGKMRHQDNKGGGGVIGPGDAQWMTAGQGLIHSEMPVLDADSQQDQTVHGMQLWVNLPAHDKMKAPAYQDVTEDNLVIIHQEGAEIRLIAGEYQGHQGPVSGVQLNPTYMDVHMQADSSLSLELPQDHTAFIYLLDGSLTIGTQSVIKRDLAILSKGNSLTLTSTKASRFIVAAAQPTNQPVARYGPFVMNSQSEIMQAIEDYNAGKF